MMPDKPATSNPPPAATDAFFVLRECRELFLRSVQEIVRQATAARPVVIEAFTLALGAAFDELAAAAAARDGFGQTDGLTASRISLVGNDELELEIRVGDIAARLKNNEHADFWRTSARFATLLNRPTLDADSSPIGVQPICRGLAAMSRASGDPIEQSLDRLDCIEELLQAKLPETYAGLNALLERHHVEPAPMARGRAEPARQIGVDSAPEVDGQAPDLLAGGSNALATLVQTLQRQAATREQSPAANALTEPSFSTRGTGGSHAASEAATMVMLQHLLQRLDAIEQQAPPPRSLAADGARHALRTWPARDFDLPLEQPAAVALDTLALIFEAIFTTPELPDAVKPAIARLQIPLLKLALRDASLFANAQHPVRRLIDRMARAVLGLAANAGREHPVCLALLELGDQAHTAIEDGDNNLASVLGELDTLIGSRDRLHQEKAAPYIPLVRRHLASAAASADAAAWLAEMLGKTGAPAMRSFMTSYWQRVMQLASLDGGSTGARWKECQATADELLWSVAAKPTAEERKQLLARIPLLLGRINAGLDLLGTTKAERQPFLDACFELQTAALRNRADPAPVTVRTPTADFRSGADGSALTIDRVELDGLRVRYLRDAKPESSPSRAGKTSWPIGDWFRLRLPDGSTPCGRLSWHGEPPTDGILLFNVDWGDAIVCTPSLLEKQLENGQASIANHASLFDAAAETALTMLAGR